MWWITAVLGLMIIGIILFVLLVNYAASETGASLEDPDRPKPPPPPAPTRGGAQLSAPLATSRRGVLLA